jgi:NADH pyrophosphatase NudC (nudix superfamily)
MAVRGEVEEEVGITLGPVQYLGHFVSTQTYNVDTVYVFSASTPSQACTIDPGEIAVARWFAVEALPRVSALPRAFCSAAERKSEKRSSEKGEVWLQMNGLNMSRWPRSLA